MARSIENFMVHLSRQGRILLLGGLAVIAHGLSRATRDADIWLEPFADAGQWSARLAAAVASYGGLQFHNLRTHGNMLPEEVSGVVECDGVVRIVGLDRPLDVFRHPHNLDIEDFDAIWQRGAMLDNGFRLPDEIDLLLTKENTSRAQDAADLAFLEAKIRNRLMRELAACELERAREIFDRYVDHETCRAALLNPREQVQELARTTLKDMAASGDPFAREILASN